MTRQVVDAVAAVQGLPVVNEDREGGGGDALKVIDADWHEDPAKALHDLRKQLSVHLDWLQREIYPKATSKTDTSSLKRLEEQGLVTAQESRIAKKTLELSSRKVAAIYDSDEEGDRQQIVDFMEKSDQICSQLRLLALDRQVRKQFKARGWKILDFEGQPRGRWPDFYTFHPKHQDLPLKVSVRMARTSHSTLVKETRERLRKKELETPLDPQVQRLLVVPKTSKAPLDEDIEHRITIPAIKRDDVTDWLKNHLARSGDPQLVE